MKCCVSPGITRPTGHEIGGAPVGRECWAHETIDAGRWWASWKRETDVRNVIHVFDELIFLVSGRRIEVWC